MQIAALYARLNCADIDCKKAYGNLLDAIVEVISVNPKNRGSFDDSVQIPVSHLIEQAISTNDIFKGLQKRFVEEINQSGDDYDDYGEHEPISYSSLRRAAAAARAHVAAAGQQGGGAIREQSPVVSSHQKEVLAAAAAARAHVAAARQQDAGAIRKQSPVVNSHQSEVSAAAAAAVARAHLAAARQQDAGAIGQQRI